MYAFSNDRAQEWPDRGPVLSAFDPPAPAVQQYQPFNNYFRSEFSSACQTPITWLQCAPQCAPNCNLQPVPTQISLQDLPCFSTHLDYPQWQSPLQHRLPRSLHSAHATMPTQLCGAVLHTVQQRSIQGSDDHVQHHSRFTHAFPPAVVHSDQGALARSAHHQAAGFGRFANVSRQLDLAVDDSCLPSDMTFPFELLRGASTSPLTSMSMMRLPATTEEQRCTQPPNQCNAQAEMKEDPANLHSSITRLPEVPPISSPERDESNSDEFSGTDRPAKQAGRKKTKIDHITVEYLEKHQCFDMPLAEAAKSLDVGLSVMKRVCRTLGLARWPYRTRQSLRSVIHKTEQYLVADDETTEGEASSGQKAHVIEALQSQMSAVTGRGGSDLNAAIKKYRQSIFKLNYKLKKSKTTPSARHKIAVPLNAAERILADQS